MNIKVEIKSGPTYAIAESFVQILKEVFEVAATAKKFSDIVGLVSQFTDLGYRVTLTTGVITIHHPASSEVLIQIFDVSDSTEGLRCSNVEIEFNPKRPERGAIIRSKLPSGRTANINIRCDETLEGIIKGFEVSWAAYGGLNHVDAKAHNALVSDAIRYAENLDKQFIGKSTVSKI